MCGMIVRTLAALAAATAAIGVAACGGEPASNASTADRQAAMRKAMLDYARCMREHGVDMPDPQFSSEGGKAVIQQGGPGSKATPEKVKAAEAACRKYRDQVKPPEMSEADKEKFRKAALANARCMREHGIDFPDPKFDENGGAQIELRKGNIDPNSERFKAAQKACESTMPGGGGPSTTAVRP